MKGNQKEYNPDGIQEQLLEIVRELSTSPAENPQQRYKSLRDILMIIFNIALSSFYFGYCMVYLPAVDFNVIYNAYNIPINYQVAQGLLVACVAIGGGLGAVSSSLLISRFSRRQSLLIVNALAIIAGFLLYVQNFQFFVFARLFQGFCTGLLSSIAPLMMKQLSPTEISGTLTSCHQIFITFGATFGFVFSMMLSYIMNDNTGDKKWGMVFGFSLIILIVQTWFLIFKFNFETPKYLLQNNRQSQAKQLVQRIYKPQYVDEVFNEMKANLKHDHNNPEEQGGIQMVNRNLENFGEEIKTPQQNHTPETPRSATIAALHLAILQQCCGVNAVVAYGGQIVGEHQPQLKQAMPIIINMLQFGGAIIAAFLLTRIGRKFLLQMGAITTSIGATIVAIGFMNESLTQILFGLIFFMACFGLTLGPVVWIYLPQVAQPKILSFATAANWATCSLVMLLFPIIKKALPGENPALLFLFFAAWGLGSFFINKKFVIETRNKGEKQIFNQYSAMQSFC